MRLILLSFICAACLTACSPAGETPSPKRPAEPAPVEATPAPATPPADAPSAPDQPGEGAASPDDCGAAERQSWVGQPRSAVPPTPPGADWRIFETGDALIQDLRSDRLNVEISPSTQRVVSVRCY